MHKHIILYPITLLLIIPFISAFGPFTHDHLATIVITDNSTTTVIKDIINKYQDAFYAGLEFPDVSVIYYYTSFKTYQATHDWNFQQKLLELAETDEERAFAYGVAVHLAHDSISHNYFVPDRIKTLKMPNYLVHPIVELKIDGKYLNPHTTHMLDPIDKYLPLTKKALGRDFTKEAGLLRAAVGGGTFYDDAFAIPKAGLWWNIYKKFADIMGPIISEKSSVEFQKMAIESTEDIMEGTYPILNPSGKEALDAADSEIYGLYWILSFTFTAILYIIAKKKEWI